MLDGMFSFVLLDTRDNSFIAARDAIGITPLYMGWGLDGMWLYFGVECCFSDHDNLSCIADCACLAHTPLHY